MMLALGAVADPKAALADIFAAEGCTLDPLARLSVNCRDEWADKAKDAAPQM